MAAYGLHLQRICSIKKLLGINKMPPKLHYGAFPMTLIGISKNVRVTLQAINTPNISETCGDDKNR